jgi:prolipoprotein diacylglyceryltransferase
MQPLNYAINEGFKLSWKGALIGGAIGSAIGYTTAQNMVAKDNSSGLVASFVFVAVPFIGLTLGTLGGFVGGAVKGSVDWAINGPFEPHSPDDESIRLGINLTTAVAKFVFNRNSDED